jgi:transposase
MVNDLRAMCDAVAYVVKNGIEWRALPVDFPPWDAVYAFCERWNGRGLPQVLICRLRELLRQYQGRKAQPTACIADSQIVKAHYTVSKATSGSHGGKKITGRGRHLAVDREGWLLALVVSWLTRMSGSSGCSAFSLPLTCSSEYRRSSSCCTRSRRTGFDSLDGLGRRCRRHASPSACSGM